MSQQGDNAHRSGRHFRTKLMSRYIGADQNDRFDVRMQELVSKAKNPGGFFEKKRFLNSILALEPKFHADWSKNGHATRKNPKNGP